MLKKLDFWPQSCEVRSRYNGAGSVAGLCSPGRKPAVRIQGVARLGCFVPSFRTLGDEAECRSRWSAQLAGLGNDLRLTWASARRSRCPATASCRCLRHLAAGMRPSERARMISCAPDGPEADAVPPSRSPAPVRRVRRLAKIPQRFRNLLCGVCRGAIVPFLGPVPEGASCHRAASLAVGGALAKTTIREVAGPGEPLSRVCLDRSVVPAASPGGRPNAPGSGRTARAASLRPPTVSTRAARGSGDRGQAR